MAAPDGKLGDPFASREVTVKKMLDAIGRDATDLTWTPAAETAAASLPDDPDVHMAWHALSEAYADVMQSFRLFNTFRVEISEASGKYTIPNDPTATDLAYDADVVNQSGTNGSFIASVRVIEQPADLNLVWLNRHATDYSLFDTVSGDDNANAGKGDVVCEVTYYMQWGHIPQVFKKYIFTAATRRFIQRAVGATDYIGFTQQDEQMAFARCQQYDLEMAPANFFAGSGSGERPAGTAQRILDRGPY